MCKGFYMYCICMLYFRSDCLKVEPLVPEPWSNCAGSLIIDLNDEEDELTRRILRTEGTIDSPVQKLISTAD